MNASTLPSLKTILVPVTLTAESCLALPEAVRLVQKYGGEIILFHVVQLNIVGERRGIPLTEIRSSLCVEAEQKLERLARDFTDADVAIRVCVVDGDPAKKIAQQANEIGADVIVMVRHTHRTALKWLYHNTAEHLLKHAPCPVWMLYPHQGNGSMTTIVADIRPAKVEAKTDSYENLQALRSLLRI